MAKMTSAYANKLIKQLTEDRAFWVNKEDTSQCYTAALDEEPVIPEYDYAEVAGIIEEIDEKICRIKHAINLANVSSFLEIGGRKMSVDTVLVRMAQLNNRKSVLNYMRKQQPQSRINANLFGAKKPTPEYKYLNYDLELVKEEYERINSIIMEMQIELDKHNQTFEFEVEL